MEIGSTLTIEVRLILSLLIAESTGVKEGKEWVCCLGKRLMMFVFTRIMVTLCRKVTLVQLDLYWN